MMNIRKRSAKDKMAGPDEKHYTENTEVHKEHRERIHTGSHLSVLCDFSVISVLPFLSRDKLNVAPTLATFSK